MTEPILHAGISAAQRERAAARLPSMVTVLKETWLRADPILAAQVAHKQALVAHNRDSVIAVTEGAEPAAAECLDHIVDWLITHEGASLRGDLITRAGLPPVKIDRRDPLGTLAGLVAEDLCLLQRRGDEHVFVAALLGFPSGWTLAEKIGRPMMGIHHRVPSYDDTIGVRVQRMFDNLPAGRIMGRANLHPADHPRLFWPLSEHRPPDTAPIARIYERSEWQTISRLPKTDTILFTIHVSIAKAEQGG